MDFAVTPEHQEVRRTVRHAEIVLRVARAAYLGIDDGDLSSLEDPVALEPVRAAARA